MNSSATELIKSAGVSAILAAIACCALLPTGLAQTARETSASKTQVVLLGTGTPTPDPDRSGPATAIVVNGTPYLIDFGPGVVRRVAAAQRGVQGLSVVDLKVVFLTHLHSDHTVGYPDLILTPWAIGRAHALEVYGPKGLARMTGHILEAYGRTSASADAIRNVAESSSRQTDSESTPTRSSRASSTRTQTSRSPRSS